MNEFEFKKYLEKKKVESQLITGYIKQIKNYEKYLSKENLNLEKSLPKKIMDYSDYLVLQDEDSVLDFLRAIMNYANYSKRYEFITKVIDISESYNAMDNLFSRVAEIHGETLRDEIFKDLTLPPLGVHPEKKPEFTKAILKRLEENLGKESTLDLLSPCLHGRPPDDIEGDKKLLKELGIDGFLEKKHKDLITRLEKHRDEGTLEFAQKIDDEIVQYVRDNQMMAGGIREGNLIYVSKLPYQMREFLDAKDDRMKKFFVCYCPWIRGALKKGTEKEITKDFCNCSAGWYKLYWDQIFELSIKVEPIKTALNDDLECTFAIYLPDDLPNSYKIN
ncbi:MAG: hypothetical protein KGD66_10065 [Candidatus Lokiarchaeota archaeon]|nr:hypothetical protein [Candidatus Lokiarchaeota archaeon]